jgi:hypothetical protein
MGKFKKGFSIYRSLLEVLNFVLGSHKLTKHIRKPLDLGGKMQDSESNVLLDKGSDINSSKSTPISQSPSILGQVKTKCKSYLTHPSGPADDARFRS